MYRPPSKRSAFWRLTATYAAMVVAILSLVTVLVFVILGFRYNGDDGKIEQGGLVQFATQPTGATVAIDSIPFGARTATKATLAAGSHSITMNREGYQEWRKSVSVVPGAVLWLNYARLIPQKMEAEKIAAFSTISSSVASPNRDYMIASTDPALPELELADISDTQPIMTKLALPQDLYTHPTEGKTQHFSVVEWDKDNRFVLVKHTIDGTPRIEWLMVDTRTIAESKNITRLLNIDSSEMRFSRDSSQALYALTQGDVRKIELGAATLSRPLVSNVAEFDLYRDTGVTYVTNLDPETKQRAVGYVLDADTEPRHLRVYSDDGTTPLHIDIGEYFSDVYVAIAYGAKVSIVTGNVPKTAAEFNAMDRVATMDLANTVNRLTIITSGRFVVAEMNDSYAVYDLELKRQTVTPLKGSSQAGRQLEWIDGYMPWSDRDGMLRLYEFDGENQHDIIPVVSGQAVTLSRNGTYLYSVGKTADGQSQLQRVRLILQ